MRFNYQIVISFTVFQLIGIVPASGQVLSRIDFTEIEREVSDSMSHYYYPSLYERFIALDTTLSVTDYRHLYYGAVFQSFYRPYEISTIHTSFIDHYDDHMSTEEGRDTLLLESAEILRRNPMDLEIILRTLVIHVANNNVEMTRYFARHYFSLLDVIYESGDGEQLESAFVVISVADEYRVVGDKKLHVIHQELQGECDQLFFRRKGQDRKDRVEHYYFNVQFPLSTLSNVYSRSH